LIEPGPERHALPELHAATWIGGCERCAVHLVALCADAGFEPRIGSSTDDMVLMQALVVVGLGVTTLPGLALKAHRHAGIVAGALSGAQRHVYAASYGDPPDPPATAALLDALVEAAGHAARG
jgi:DNA-binding transcriptional LysR family regulator